MKPKYERTTVEIKCRKHGRQKIIMCFDGYCYCEKCQEEYQKHYKKGVMKNEKKKKL